MSHWVLIFTLLRISDIEHIFMYLLFVCKLSAEKSLQAFCPLFNWVIWLSDAAFVAELREILSWLGVKWHPKSLGICGGLLKDDWTPGALSSSVELIHSQLNSLCAGPDQRSWVTRGAVRKVYSCPWSLSLWVIHSLCFWSPSEEQFSALVCSSTVRHLLSQHKAMSSIPGTHK